MRLISFTCDVSHAEIFLLNEVASRNIHIIIVTPNVSQTDIPPLKEVALVNILLVSVTYEVFLQSAASNILSMFVKRDVSQDDKYLLKEDAL